MAMLGAITTPLQPLISLSTTSLEAWTTLASTYGRPSRRHMKSIKEQLKKSEKGQRTIDDYIQSMKTKADQLALLGKPLDHEDVIEYILDGLDEDYRVVIDQINGRDIPPTLEELHEKLVNREVAILCSQPAAPFPVTANNINHRHKGPPRPHHQASSNRFNPDQRSPRPYLGKCQACGTQGHSAKRCPLFRIVNASSSTYHQPTSNWQPRAYHTTITQPGTPSWMLDSGASHHVTSDLANLSLHSPFQGNDDVHLGDGSSLEITHTGSLSLPSRHRPLALNNTLFVPKIQKNLISIRRLCEDNNVSVLFDPWSFQVRDLKTEELKMDFTNGLEHHFPPINRLFSPPQNQISSNGILVLVTLL